MKKNICYLVFLSLMACKKDPPPLSVDCSTPTNKEAICKQLILGRWEWVRTFTHFGQPSTITPQTIGHNVQFNFKADGIMETYLDGQFRDTSSYRIYDAGTFFKLDSGITHLSMRGCDYIHPNFVAFYASPRSVRLQVCDDSLYLPYEDLIYHEGNDIYRRVK